MQYSCANVKTDRPSWCFWTMVCTRTFRNQFNCHFANSGKRSCSKIKRKWIATPKSWTSKVRRWIFVFVFATINCRIECRPRRTDSNKLAEILLQRPLDMRGPSISGSRLTDADIAYMQQQAKKHFDVVLDTLKQMPRNMLFIIRLFVFHRPVCCLLFNDDLGLFFLHHFPWLGTWTRFVRLPEHTAIQLTDQLTWPNMRNDAFTHRVHRLLGSSSGLCDALNSIIIWWKWNWISGLCEIILRSWYSWIVRRLKWTHSLTIPRIETLNNAELNFFRSCGQTVFNYNRVVQSRQLNTSFSR